ncbi:MAG: class II poly(R)-hydroxyalkanoic acid synthase, partial [Pseudomonadales bacterium]
MVERDAAMSQVLEDRPEPTVTLNPLTGLHWEDIREVAAKTALQGLRQPLILSKHVAAHGRKLLDVLAGDTGYTPDTHDRRFQDAAWQESAFYQRLMQSYLAMGESLQEWVDDLQLNEVDKLRAAFLMRVVGDSISPTNTLWGNPPALRKSVDTRGASLVKGARNWLHDLRHNHAIPAQVKSDNFAVGKNLATSPGAVVFRNEVLELIQYAPSTAKVYRRPLLLVSAMINKFYALDLTPERSLVKYCVDNGIQLFVVSWVNPWKSQANLGIEQYALAVIEAIATIKSSTHSK